MSDEKPMKVSPPKVDSPKVDSPTMESPKVEGKDGGSMVDNILESVGLSSSGGGSA